MKKLTVFFSVVLFLMLWTAPRSFAEDANELTNQAVQAMNSGKADEALALLKRAAELSPADPEKHMNYASILFSKGAQLHQASKADEAKPMLQEAEEILKKALTLFSEDPKSDPLKAQVYFLLGDLFNHAKGDKKQAKEYYQKSLNLYSEHGGARQALMAVVDEEMSRGIKNPDIEAGIKLARQGNFDEAITKFSKAIAANPQDAYGYYNRGLAYRLKNDMNAAIADYSKAVELNPAESNFYNVRAITYFLHKNYDKSWADVHQSESLGGWIDPAFLEALKKDSKRDK